MARHASGSLSIRYAKASSDGFAKPRRRASLDPRRTAPDGDPGIPPGVFAVVHWIASVSLAEYPERGGENAMRGLLTTTWLARRDFLRLLERQTCPPAGVLQEAKRIARRKLVLQA